MANNHIERADRITSLKKAFKERILVIDGAMGTALQSKNLKAEDFGGEVYEGCNENLVLTRPDVIKSIHADYLAAGADIVETNTFGGTPFVLDEFELGAKVYEINLKAAQLARQACAEHEAKVRDGQTRYVAGSVGPTTKALSVTGGISFYELVAQFSVQIKALYEGGVDYFLLETCQDMRNVKAAVLAITEFQQTLPLEQRLPIAVSVTIEPMGTMLAGQTVEAAVTSLEHLDLLYFGLNCATGPEFMTDHIRTLAQVAPWPIGCVPNAGLPDENGKYLETPEMVAAVVSRFVEQGWVNLVGGCCGTTAPHIAALAKVAQQGKARDIKVAARSSLSGIEFLEIQEQGRPWIVGERTNVIGSKKFKELIASNQFDEASEIAKSQVKNGAHVIDVCLANPDRSEFDDMKIFLEFLIKKIKAPLMIDSTDDKVIEMALSYSQGKAIINSINLEDGEERFEKVVPMARKFGAALVVGTIDEDPLQGMGVSRQRKLEIAARSYKLLTEKYGVKPSDIYFDPLVFPCATGDEQYVGSAVETIEGIRLIKQSFPLTKTVLGISNVSFGLPTAGREVLNSVFLHHCVQAGLDLAIVNSEKLERYSHISEVEKKLCDDLLWNRGADPIAAFSAHFRNLKVTDKTAQRKADRLKQPLLERLAQAIVEGSKEGLIDDLNEAMNAMRPLEIINGPLMKGMDEVGRLFNKNELIVAEVLQSAEVMKAAVAHLEPFMEKTDTALRGSIVLATVKGDVHDIGKNLVDIILTNNGFKVINLGIKIPPAQLIEAVRTHNPDMIGLSGLLVKSAHQMVATAEDLAKAGVDLPILVGGAALSRNFTDKSIAPAYNGEVIYAKDAMTGLELAKKVVNSESFAELRREQAERRANLLKEGAAGPFVEQRAQSDVRSNKVPVLEKTPSVPDWERHVLRNVPVDALFDFINPLMLYGRHLGIKGADVRQLGTNMDRSTAAYKVWQSVEEVKAMVREENLLRPRAVYQFVRAKSQGNRLLLAHENGQPWREFLFPRQLQDDGLCIADYAMPENKSYQKSGDSVALFVVSAGYGVRQKAEELKAQGQYLKCQALQSLALETAEAFAEYLHSKIRGMWGSPDPMGMTMMERFQAKYMGKRYSFGYPACPQLSDQEILFDMLKPQDIGVELTDGYMMEPEASVSAIVFHHPNAAYFSVGESRS